MPREEIRTADAVVVSRGAPIVRAEEDLSAGPPLSGGDDEHPPPVEPDLPSPAEQPSRRPADVRPADRLTDRGDDTLAHWANPSPSSLEAHGVAERQRLQVQPDIDEPRLDDGRAPYEPPPPVEPTTSTTASPDDSGPALADERLEGSHADEDDQPPLPSEPELTCRIAVWRGYRKSTFYAQAFDADGQEVALAESPLFRYRGNGMPEKTEAAAKAHRALVEELRDAGYVPAQEGSSWFDLTLTRR